MKQKSSDWRSTLRADGGSAALAVDCGLRRQFMNFLVTNSSSVAGVSSRMEFGFHCVLPPSRRQVISDVPTGVTVRSSVSWHVTP